MGCNSDYMEPTSLEVNISVVYGLLDEIETGILPNNYGSGTDPRVYNKGFGKNLLDTKTEELCSKLQKVDVTEYSLEMQIWWRDHQIADKKRIEEEMLDSKTKSDRDALLERLTPYERKLLNL